MSDTINSVVLWSGWGGGVEGGGSEPGIVGCPCLSPCQLPPDLTGTSPPPLLTLIILQRRPKLCVCESGGSEGRVEVDPLTLISVLLPHGRCWRASFCVGITDRQREKEVNVIRRTQESHQINQTLVHLKGAADGVGRWLW